MNFSCVTRNAFSFLPLLIILSITPLSSSFSPSDKVTKPLLYQLCSQPTIYKHFCVAWLTSDPTTFTLDLSGLVTMVFQKTESLSYKNLAMLKGLWRTTTDPKLKIPYGSCMAGYEFSNKALDLGRRCAIYKVYVIASRAAFKAFDRISTCEARLEGLPIPAYVSSRNLMFERMCNIGKVFSELLTI